ncbi:MAG: hypothetical protein KGI75_23005 [Rhizobiaceae bacterium]|nr:hypothetical protein [Rhizobiaceae bacterium]
MSSDYKGLPVSLKIDNETYIVLTQGRRKFAVPYLGIFSETAPSYLPLMALGFSYLNRTNAQFVRGMAFLSGKGIIPTEMLTPICVGPINSTDCSDYNHSSEQTLHGHSVTIQAATLEML